MKKLILFITAIFMLNTNQIKAEVYGSISGKVVTDKDVPVEGVKLNWGNYKDVNEMSKLMEAGKFFVKSVITDKNGFYKLEKLPTGKYYLVLPISLPKEYSLYKETKKPNMPVELPKGQNLVDVNFEIRRYYGTITGKVFKNDGVTPYPNIGVVILKTDKEPLSVSSDSSGVFKFKQYTPANGECRVMVEFYDTSSNYYYYYVPDTVIDLSQTQDITDLNIVAGEMPLTGFHGVVKNVDGTIFPRGIVSVRSAKWKSFSFNKSVNEEGLFEIKGLILGEYEITISLPFSEEDKIKIMTIDSTFSINSVGEQKEINLFYDDKKSITEDFELKFE